MRTTNPNSTQRRGPRWTMWLAMLLAVLMMTACAGSKNTLKGPQPLNSTSILDEVTYLMPEETTGVVVVDMNRLMTHHLVTAFGLVGDDWDHAQMTNDLRRLFQTHYGLDFTRARWAAIGGNDTPVVLIQGDMGKPPASMKTEIGGMMVFANPKIEGLTLIPLANHTNLYALCLEEDQVKLIAAMQTGQRKSMKGSAKAARLKMLLERVGPGDMTIAALLDSVDDEIRAEVPLGIGETSGAFAASVSDRLVVAIQGDPKELEATATKITQAIETFREGLKEEMNTPAAEVEDPNELIASTWMYHVSGALSQQISPSLEGDLLVYDVSMDTLTHPVTIIGGIIGAVAWMFGEMLGGFEDAFPTGPPAGTPPPTSGLDAPTATEAVAAGR